ncbi:LOB domain-containing protein 36 [Cajanus cajan]|uniref:LOB domain-containing protein 36 n=1 Tax=Cajanus cajan TaxID=3821 RepID=UPI00098DCFEF|nr:LOB domain-containing protein 36 [Cajanus cajan]
MSSSNSPCAACKLLRRKCTQECVFAPYFPPDNPQRFACVHRVFGASNVAKLLNELSMAQREDAVKSLAYEAEARLRDPVYGCVGFISLLQQRLRQIQTELHNAKKELSTYVSPQAMQVLLANPGMLPPMLPHLHHQSMFNNCGGANNVASQVLVAHGGGGGDQMVIRDTPPQEFLEAQQMALVPRDHHFHQHHDQYQDQQRNQHQDQHQDQHQHQHQHQVMFRNYEEQEFMKFDNGFEQSGGGFGSQVECLPPSLSLGSFENVGPYPVQQHGEQQHPMEAQLLLTPQQQQSQEQPHQQRCESEDGRTVVPA